MSAVCVRPMTLPWVGPWETSFLTKKQLDIPEMLGMGTAN